jgi:hypothetical protein
MIISDSWPAYIRLEFNLPEYTHKLICHKKAKIVKGKPKLTRVQKLYGAGFSRLEGPANWVRPMNINTNKIEGFWAQIKQYYKRIRGSSSRMTPSYVASAVFRMNVSASAKLGGPTFPDALVELIKMRFPC